MTPDEDRPGIRMADVTAKEITAREAVATCCIRMAPETLRRVVAGELEKGDPLEVARVAAVLGAKKTPDIVPLCHPIAVGGVTTSFDTNVDRIDIRVHVRTSDRTGVEMEALVAAAAAALTIYDMIKSIDRAAGISDLHLLTKSGGRSGTWQRVSRDDRGTGGTPT